MVILETRISEVYTPPKKEKPPAIAYCFGLSFSNDMRRHRRAGKWRLAL